MSNYVFSNVAEWAVGTKYETVPDQALKSAKHALLDHLGVALAGSEHVLAPKLRAYVDVAGSDQVCGLVGRHGRASVESAALFNATMGHVLDFDDSSDALGGHPTVPMLPSLLALSEVRRYSGRELLTAYCVGYEVLAHLANLVNFEHYDKGWHPTATLGVMGCAAACAKLLGLDAAGVSAALSIAASFASGLKVNFGTDMKSVQVGHAAQQGLVAARMAAAGITGRVNAFEGERGFGAVYNGPGLFRSHPIQEGPDRIWDLVEPGLVIKQYPCCGSTHPAIDAARVLREGVGDCRNIESVVVRLHPRRLAHTNRPVPVTALEAKFSVQYAVAAALVRGNVALHDFDEEQRLDPAVNALLSRVVAEPLPEERYGPEHFAGEVELTLTNGERHMKRVEKAKGRGSRFALSDDEIISKFHGCTQDILPEGVGQDVMTSVFDLDNLRDVRPIIGMVTDL